MTTPTGSIVVPFSNYLLVLFRILYDSLRYFPEGTLMEPVKVRRLDP